MYVKCANEGFNNSETTGLKPSGCIFSKNEYEVGDYLQNKLLKNVAICPFQYTDAELQCYRDKFYDFRNNIMQSSNTPYDTVDKINELYLSGNTDDAHGYKNKRIADLFTNLTTPSN